MKSVVCNKVSYLKMAMKWIVKEKLLPMQFNNYDNLIISLNFENCEEGGV